MHNVQMGLGTWMMGESIISWNDEMAIIREAIRRGIRIIDTAEMYGQGQSECLIGEAIQVFDREEIYLVSKVLPENAHSMHSIVTSCKDSIKRMDCDYLDLYLLHWAHETTDIKLVVNAFNYLKQQGLIKAWGVSNFDVEAMQNLMEIEGGKECSTNQVLFHLGSRGIETELIPWHIDHNIPIMAYSPLGHSQANRKEIERLPLIKTICDKYKISIAQLMLAFVFRYDEVIAIPRTRSMEHLNEILDVKYIKISKSDWDAIDAVLPFPKERVPLDEI